MEAGIGVLPVAALKETEGGDGVSASLVYSAFCRWCRRLPWCRKDCRWRLAEMKLPVGVPPLATVEGFVATPLPTLTSNSVPASLLPPNRCSRLPVTALDDAGPGVALLYR